MTSDDRRSRLVARLIIMTQRHEIAWQRAPLGDAPLGGFWTSANGLRFSIRKEPSLVPPSGRRRDSVVVVLGVFDAELPGNLPINETWIDAFSEIDRMPILRDLYEIVEQNVGDADGRIAKIDKFLDRDVTHAQ